MPDEEVEVLRAEILRAGREVRRALADSILQRQNLALTLVSLKGHRERFREIQDRTEQLHGRTTEIIRG